MAVGLPDVKGREQILKVHIRGLVQGEKSRRSGGDFLWMIFLMGSITISYISGSITISYRAYTIFIIYIHGGGSKPIITNSNDSNGMNIHKSQL